MIDALLSSIAIMTFIEPHPFSDLDSAACNRPDLKNGIDRVRLNGTGDRRTCGWELEMMTSGLKWLIVASLAAGFAAAAQAEDVDVGRSEFQSSCASCHGADGKGKGPVSEQLKVPPPDLTILARKNNGVFPTNAVYEIIYGSKTVPAHGTREMPIWGYRFNPVMNLPHIVDPTYDVLDPSRELREVVVRTRILTVIDYLNRIQEK